MADWYVRSAAAGTGTGADWTNAKTTLSAALSSGAAGDRFFVSEDHAESTAGSVTLTSPGTPGNPCLILCVNHAGSVPPVSADLRTTATVTTTGNTQIIFLGSFYSYGVIYTGGNAASTGGNPLKFGNDVSGSFEQIFDACQLATAIASGGNFIASPTSGGLPSYKLIFKNTTVKFGATNQAIAIGSGVDFIWLNTPSAVAGTNIPTSLIKSAMASAAGHLSMLIIGVDLSALGSGKNLIDLTSVPTADFYLRDCKLGASVAFTTGSPIGPGVHVEAVNCDSANTNYRYYRQHYRGTEQQETTIVRSGGATDGTTPVSRKIVTTANAKFTSPYESEWILFWDNSPGAKTISIPIVNDGVTLTNADAWIECEYLGTSGFPQGNFANDAASDPLATAANQSSDTSTWTTTGLTTPIKQILSATFTTTGKGLIRARVKVARASTTLYFDPLILASSGRQFMLGESGYMNEAAQAAGGTTIIPINRVRRYFPRSMPQRRQIVPLQAAASAPQIVPIVRELTRVRRESIIRPRFVPLPAPAAAAPIIVRRPPPVVRREIVRHYRPVVVPTKTALIVTRPTLVR